MKKSTVLLLIVVYILSFFLIGLLGHSLRTYNEPEVYPEAVELSDPDEKTELTLKPVDEDTGEILCDYYFLLREYQPGMSVRIKATVKPENCTYPDVHFIKDEQNLDFNLYSHISNPEIEEGFCEITLNKSLEPLEPATLSFSVETQNPGTTIKATARVTFVGAF